MLGKNKLRELRDKKHISTRRLSRMSGISASAITHIENHQVSPTFETMILISRALHVDVWDIFYY